MVRRKAASRKRTRTKYVATIGYARSSGATEGWTGSESQNAGNEAWVRKELGRHPWFATFSDEGVSGVDIGPGLASALKVTKSGSPGVFVVEDVTRISRHQEKAIAIIRGLVKRGWRVVCRKSGIDTAAGPLTKVLEQLEHSAQVAKNLN